MSVRENHEEFVRLLVNAADTCCADNSGVTPLHLAQTEGIARLLLENGALPNMKTSDGQTPLQFACHCGFESVASILLDHGADIEAMADDNLIRPLHILSTSPKNMSMLRMLLNRGAKCDSTPRNGTTALHMASLKDLPLVVEALLESGANTEARDRHGRTPLHSAVLTSHEESIRALLKGKADINSTDSSGTTALHLVKDPKLLLSLVENGANLHAKDSTGSLPLHWQVSKNSVESVKILLQCGSIIDARDNDQATALHFARDPTMATILLEKGAEITAANAHGATVLHYAILRKSQDMFQFFVRKMSHV